MCSSVRLPWPVLLGGSAVGWVHQPSVRFGTARARAQSRACPPGNCERFWSGDSGDEKRMTISSRNRGGEGLGRRIDSLECEAGNFGAVRSGAQAGPCRSGNLGAFWSGDLGHEKRVESTLRNGGGEGLGRRFGSLECEDGILGAARTGVQCGPCPPVNSGSLWSGDSGDEKGLVCTLRNGDGERSGQKFGSLECEDGRGGDRGSSTSQQFALFSVAPMMVYPLIAEGAGYSQASYYTSLGLFVISVPGIWSLVKRSIKSKIVRKTFAMPGPKVDSGKPPSQIAGEITSSLVRNNFAVAERGETVTFEGTMVPSRGQAAFLSFCTAVSLASVALVLSITAPDIGGNWYYLTVLSPLAGFYYWTRAARKEQIQVKMVVADDESSTDVIIQGDDEQIDRLRRELGLMEKGMVYVKGILER